jgi:tRNA(His) guanylyltransferase
VVDYFRWRQEDAHRNALNGHSLLAPAWQGLDDHEATTRLQGVSVAERNELLFRAGVNFNDVPAWQKRGIGVLWEDEAVVQYELPMKSEFDALVRGIVQRQ